MALCRSLLVFLPTITVLVDALTNYSQISGNSYDITDSMNGVYSECFLDLSYTCLQRKTLSYLNQLNRLKEVSIIGDYVKFVKLNTSEYENDTSTSTNAEELAYLIDGAVDQFFDSHFIRVKALGKDIMVPETVEEFVGRKRRKGGGGGGGGGHGGDDGGKKKMLMMAMMCMKMKFMMMVPAMMGMMGMMSFKGMVFSMMSFMLSKMMLLMKLLEKKGGGGGGGGGGGWNAGGGDGGWAGGGGGAWMPAGQDYGGGGGYDANGQWQSRSIIENSGDKPNKPIVSYVKPTIRYNNKINEKKPLAMIKNLKDEIIKIDQVKSMRRKRSTWKDLDDDDSKYSEEYLGDSVSDSGNGDRISDSVSKKRSRFKNANKSRNKRSILNNISKSIEGYSIDDINKPRKKRSIIEDLHRAYVYWASKVLGVGHKKTTYPKYRFVNGVKYVYQPVRATRIKTPKELTSHDTKQLNVSDFNKGEIAESAVGRMNRKKFNKMKENVNETMDDNPWE